MINLSIGISLGILGALSILVLVKTKNLLVFLFNEFEKSNLTVEQAENILDSVNIQKN